MTRGAVLALACVALAAAARYPDYGKMPEYAAAADYEGPRDAPAAPRRPDYVDPVRAGPSLDYKYDEIIDHSEKPRSKSKLRERESLDGNDWQNEEERLITQKWPNDDSSIETSDMYSSDDSRKFKDGKRFSQRARPKPRSLETQSSYHSKHRNENNDFESDDDFRINRNGKKRDYVRDKNNDFDYSENILKTKKPRRLPRARTIDQESDEDYDLAGMLSGRFSKRPEDVPSFTSTPGGEGQTMSDDPLLDRAPPPNYTLKYKSTEKPQGEIAKNTKKDYEYEEYYDRLRASKFTKRSTSILDDLTTTWAPETPEFVDARRAMDEMPVSVQATRTHLSTEEVTTTLTTATEDLMEEPTTTKTQKPELSLAEKSRLSILKKALKKESVADKSTKKPPVLLQLTTKMHTLIMVEPLGTQPMHARLVSDDSPERVDRVKRLMRNKLISQAKDMKDLTSNWDDMVCDYIDVDLLNDSTVICRDSLHNTVSMLDLAEAIDIFYRTQICEYVLDDEISKRCQMRNFIPEPKEVASGRRRWRWRSASCGRCYTGRPGGAPSRTPTQHPALPPTSQYTSHRSQ